MREILHQNSIWDWLGLQRPEDVRHNPINQQKALALLAKKISDGSILDLDSLDSPLSRKLKEKLGANRIQMNKGWALSPQDWVCPCCRRTKERVARKGKEGQILAKLVEHHDHMDAALEAAFYDEFKSIHHQGPQQTGLSLVYRMGGAFAAYDRVLICEDCNQADTKGKSVVGAPKHFSFSIGQIRSFIRPVDGASHATDTDAVKSAWDKARPPYERRMEMIRTVARAAATNAHWYEAAPIQHKVVDQSSDYHFDKWLSTDQIIGELTSGNFESKPNFTRWRTTPERPEKPLGEGYIALIQSESSAQRDWNEVPEQWHCPVCRRNKICTVSVNENGKPVFSPKRPASSSESISGLPVQLKRHSFWKVHPWICNGCHATLMSLNNELKEQLSLSRVGSYDLVTPDELSAIISARPHTNKHFIKQKEARDLVALIISRCKGEQ